MLAQPANAIANAINLADVIRQQLQEHNDRYARGRDLLTWVKDSIQGEHRDNRLETVEKLQLALSQNLSEIELAGVYIKCYGDLLYGFTDSTMPTQMRMTIRQMMQGEIVLSTPIADNQQAIMGFAAEALANLFKSKYHFSRSTKARRTAVVQTLGAITSSGPAQYALSFFNSKKPETTPTVHEQDGADNDIVVIDGDSVVEKFAKLAGSYDSALDYFCDQIAEQSNENCLILCLMNIKRFILNDETACTRLHAIADGKTITVSTIIEWAYDSLLQLNGHIETQNAGTAKMGTHNQNVLALLKESLAKTFKQETPSEEKQTEKKPSGSAEPIAELSWSRNLLTATLAISSFGVALLLFAQYSSLLSQNLSKICDATAPPTNSLR